jgi:hypothetical protein
VPIGLNASRLLARAVGLSERARRLAEQTANPKTKADIAEIELEASNVRAFLTDTLRGAHGDQPPLAELERRIAADAKRLDEIEEAERGG